MYLPIKLSTSNLLILDIDYKFIQQFFSHKLWRDLSCGLLLVQPTSSWAKTLSLFWFYVLTYVLVHELGHTCVWHWLGAKKIKIRCNPDGGAYATAIDYFKQLSISNKILLYTGGPVADFLYALAIEFFLFSYYPHFGPIIAIAYVYAILFVLNVIPFQEKNDGTKILRLANQLFNC